LSMTDNFLFFDFISNSRYICNYLTWVRRIHVIWSHGPLCGILTLC